MLIQPTSNLNNHHNYKPNCNMVKRHSVSSISRIENCKNVSFKSDAGKKLYNSVRGPQVNYKALVEAANDSGYYTDVNNIYSLYENGSNAGYCLYTLGVLIRYCEPNADKYKAIEFILNHPDFESSTLEYKEYPVSDTIKDVARWKDARAYEMICDYQAKLEGETTYKSRMKQLEADEADLKKRKKAITTAEAAIQQREENLDKTIAQKTVEIREEEKIKAEEALEKKKKALNDREEKLNKEKEEIDQQNTTLNNLIQNYRSIIAEEVSSQIDDLAGGLMELYGVNPPDKLPQNMKFGDQVSYVMNVLIPRQDKLEGANDDTPETLTKAIQDDSENISTQGLYFLERIIDLCKDKCSEYDLIQAIKAVKRDFGLFDMNKVSLFTKTLSWGNNTIQSAIKKVQKLAG